MNGNVITFPVRREGRPSNADLSARVRHLETQMGALIEERDELGVELQAFVSERLEAASETRALARRVRMFVDAGHSPDRLLEQLERLADREQVRSRSTLNGAA